MASRHNSAGSVLLSSAFRITAISATRAKARFAAESLPFQIAEPAYTPIRFGVSSAGYLALFQAFSRALLAPDWILDAYEIIVSLSPTQGAQRVAPRGSSDNSSNEACRYGVKL